MALLPAFIAGGAALAGGILGKAGGDATNATNMHIARAQMKFQERMSNTSFQRGVADLKAAGLNPSMMYGGQGASSPTGSSTRVENTALPLQAGIFNALNTALQVNQQQAQVAQIEAQTRQTTALARTAEADAFLNTDGDILAKRRLGIMVGISKQQFDEAIAGMEFTMTRERASRFKEQLNHTIKNLAADEQVSLGVAREAVARAILSELQEPGAQNTASFDKSVFGKLKPYIGTAKDASQLLPTSRALQDLMSKVGPLLRRNKSTWDPITGGMIK